MEDDQAKTIPGPPPAEPEPGRRLLEKGTPLGRYVILERLGRGGMSEVYAAFDPQLDRRVAIKLLRPDVVAGMSAEEGRARVLREAQALARLSHRNVVAVHDVGQESGEIFIAMEYVEGATLRAWLTRAPRAWKEILSVFLDAGSGLAAAHDAGLVHRDFKPDNVLVTPAGRVVVLDFGLARGAGPDIPVNRAITSPGRRLPPRSVSLPLETPLTRVGELMGTPSYMSPEQLTASPVDARSDQFSFCVALYEALHGRRPFTGEHVEELLEQIGAAAFPPRSGLGAAPAWLHALLVRGLSVDPERRFESMHHLLRALEHDPAAMRRRLGRVVVAAVTLAAAFAGTTAALGIREARCQGGESRLDGVWDGRRRDAIRKAFVATGDPLAASAFSATSGALDAYRTRWGRMWTSTCVATTIRGEQSEQVHQLRMACLDQARSRLEALVDLLARADQDMVRGAAQAANSLEAVADCGDVQRLQAVAPLPQDPAGVARASALRRRLAEAEAYRMTGKAGAAGLAAAVVVEARSLGHPGLLSEALYLQGRAEESLGHSAAAVEALDGAARAALSARDDVRLVSIWGHLATVVGLREARPQDGRRWVDYARAVLPRIPSPTLPQSEIERASASLDFAEGRYAEALAGFQRALALKRDTGLGPDTVEVVKLENNVAVLLGQLGRNAEARQALERVLASMRRLHGPDHPSVASTLDNLGIVLTDLGELEAAARVQQEALAIREQSFPDGNPDIAKSLNNLGRSLNMSGRHAEARDALERALKVTRATEGPDHPMSAWVMHNLGGASLGLREPRRALEEFARGLEMLVRSQGPRHPDTALFLVGAAEAHLALQQPQQALAALDRADHVSHPEDASPQDLAEARFLRARALRALHRHPALQRTLAEEASALYEKAGPAWRREQAQVRAFLDSGRTGP